MSKELLETTKRLRVDYPELSFPLDGRLVGDIGEALVKRDFNVELHPQNNLCHDAYELESNRQIQIKSSMKYNFSFPYKSHPDYYMAVHINENATLEVIYNGLGEPIRKYIEEKGLKDYNKTWYSLTKNTLIKLNEKVEEKDKIKLKHRIEFVKGS